MTYEDRVEMVTSQEALSKVESLEARCLQLGRVSKLKKEYWLDRAAVWGKAAALIKGTKNGRH